MSRKKLANKSMLGYTMALLVSASLTGCGGGAGGTAGENSASNNTPTGVTPGPSDSTPSPAPTVNSSADIVVPESFSFFENSEITLNVQSSEDAHIAICKPASTATGNDLTIDYNDCLMKSWVRTDAYQTTINAPDHVEVLLAAVLIPSESTTPTLYEWRKEQGENWTIQL